MKKILIDGNKKFYKANLHCHSTNSDGAMSVEEIKELYKSNGYSVVAFTDHEHLIDNSYINDEDFLTITSCEIAIKDGPAEVRPSRKMDMKVCHLNLYARDPQNVDTPCYNKLFDYHGSEEAMAKVVATCEPYDRNYSGEGISEIIRIANEKGFFVSYNHPGWSLENANDYLGYKGIWAVEIYNNSCVMSGRNGYEINAYDDFLRAGHRVACMATDDSHSARTSCGGYVMINADRLEYKTIIEALENHNFYASTGPVINELYIEDNNAVLTFEKGEYAVMHTKGRRVVKKMAENPDGTNTVQFEFLPEDGYIRFDVVDKNDKRANTCAYFLDEK